MSARIRIIQIAAHAVIIPVKRQRFCQAAEVAVFGEEGRCYHAVVPCSQVLALDIRIVGLPVVGVEAQAADLSCVFSANVTKEIGFSERAKFVELDEPLNKWARTIEKALQQTDRVDRTDLITEKHYNIELEAERLQERYLQLYKERC